MSKSQYNNIIVIVVFASILLSLFFSGWEAIGIGMTIISIINFFYYTKTSFDIRHLIVLIAVIQWVFGAVLSYHFIPEVDVYKMKVESKQYFSLAIPGMFFYIVGLFFPINYKKVNKANLISRINILRLKNKNIDIFLVITGLAFSVFNKLAPESLRFIVFLLSGIQFVGLVMLLTNPYRKKKKLILIITGLFLLISGIIRGGFGLIFVWIIASFVIYNYFVKVPAKQIIIIGSIAILMIFLMQGIKMQYRSITWMSGIEYSITEKLDVFTKLVSEKQDISDEETQKSVISRINQGWIISEIIANMEVYGGEYLEGESINKAILSTVLPGSLYDEKRKAGGQEYFSRFTGRRLGKTTSMNIGVIGEAYGNYGRFGSFAFMFVFGLFLNIIFKFVIKIIIKTPIIIFFIPMLFQQVIKAEGDFFIVLNHIVKAGVFIYAIYWGLSKIYKLKV